VTHEIALAAELADEIVLLRDGRTLAAGPVRTTLTAENLRAAFRVEFDLAGGDFRPSGPAPPGRLPVI
jgi:iron complex transport system ATP-binding protein